MTDNSASISTMAPNFVIAEPRPLSNKELLRTLDDCSLLKGIRHSNNGAHPQSPQTVLGGASW